MAFKVIAGDGAQLTSTPGSMLVSAPPHFVPTAGRDWIVPMVRVGTTSKLRPCLTPAMPVYSSHSHWKQLESRGTLWLVSW